MTHTHPTLRLAAALAWLVATQVHAQTATADGPYGIGFERRQPAHASAASAQSLVLPVAQPPTASVPAHKASRQEPGQRSGSGGQGGGRGSGGRAR